jgi:hypothetical protein
MQASHVAFAMLSGFGSETTSSDSSDNADEYRRRERLKKSRGKNSKSLIEPTTDDLKLQAAGVGTSAAASAARVRKMMNAQLQGIETEGRGPTVSLRGLIIAVKEERKRMQLLLQGGASAAKVLAEEESLRQSVLGKSEPDGESHALSADAEAISPGVSHFG